MSGRSLGFALALVAVAVPQLLQAQGKIDLPVPLSTLEKQVKADSNDPAAHYNVALGYWNAKKWPDVDRELHAAVALDPRFAAAHLALAYLPFARDRHMLDGITRIDAQTPKSIRDAIDQKTREFRHAFLIDPMVDMRIMAANDISVDYWTMHDAFGQSDAALIEGLTDCEEGHYADCETNLDVYIKAYGNNARIQADVPEQVLWFDGLAAAHQKNYASAIAQFQQLIVRDSIAAAKAEKKDVIHFPIRSNEYRYFVGVLQADAGNGDAAIATLHDALEHDLSLYIAHVRLAEIYESRKDFDHAVEERRNAVNANPDDPTLNVDLGVTLGRAGRFAEAGDALKTAVQVLPRDPDAWYWYGIAMQQLGRTDEARKAFGEVVAVAPSRMAQRAEQARQHLAALK
ncbi:MAG TPA: tetratricopeptide repeat protein [Gemmatimonadales bacterium]|jgi:Tfp pilus assembly protein PilF